MSMCNSDGLPPLLAARLAWDEAAEALDRTRHEVELGLAEVEAARAL